MSQTILQLGQDAATELSLVSPTAIVANTGDIGAQKLLRALHRTCRQLAARHDWSKLRRESIFTTSAAAEQSGALETDFLRFIPDTMFNRTTRTRVAGPVTSEEWQSYQTMNYGSVFDQFYVRNSAVLITPTPAAGETIAYEYISKYIGVATNGTTERETFTADSDTTYFDDELVILGMVWRYRKAESLDYSEEFREFELRLYDCIKRDGGSRVIDMGGGNMDRLPRAPRVPDTLVF